MYSQRCALSPAPCRPEHTRSVFAATNRRAIPACFICVRVPDEPSWTARRERGLAIYSLRSHTNTAPVQSDGGLSESVAIMVVDGRADITSQIVVEWRTPCGRCRPTDAKFNIHQALRVFTKASEASNRARELLKGIHRRVYCAA